MNKKEALESALNGIEVVDPEGRKLHWNNLEFILDGEDNISIKKLPEKGWNVYEPAKEEAPEYVDIKVDLTKCGLECDGYEIAGIIGSLIERHDTRYFATWYMIGDFLWKEPLKIIGDKATFPSHVRFMREDLLGGIPE